MQHHFKKYDGVIPIWAVIEVTSFEDLSKLYRLFPYWISIKLERTFKKCKFLQF
ncbi:Abi family protein [Niallia endozanthoxylica]|uniref:Abi family protein n=1 Tax=Niallia endozanthoxylica TaxID=2036016 RepID=A0A5J5HQJ5_9BACI|nr:Abi family protein [Niallia endozanthoxylica]